MDEVTFIPLGGGQRVGASCYYLKLGNSNILLDAGIGSRVEYSFNPDLRFLVSSPFMQSLNQINQVFISHAHMDHIGYLPELMRCIDTPDIYMTELTQMLFECQLNNNESIRHRIKNVSFMQKIDFGTYKVKFYPAGHIPGAMMILFDTGKRRILYTGDYSIDSTALTDGCIIEDDLDIDTVIMCGLHAKHPRYRKRSDLLDIQVGKVLEDVLNSGSHVVCNIQQISKGVEAIKVFNTLNTDDLGVPLYIDNQIMGVIEGMERLHIPILNKYNNTMNNLKVSDINKPHIRITSSKEVKKYKKLGYNVVQMDFSLHEDFSDMKAFLKRVNPRHVVMVHCEEAKKHTDLTIEQEMMLDADCNMQFIFAEDSEVYKL